MKCTLAGAAVAAIALTAGPAFAGGVVNVYNWSDYIAEDTIARFELSGRPDERARGAPAEDD